MQSQRSTGSLSVPLALASALIAVQTAWGTSFALREDLCITAVAAGTGERLWTSSSVGGCPTELEVEAAARLIVNAYSRSRKGYEPIAALDRPSGAPVAEQRSGP